MVFIIVLINKIFFLNGLNIILTCATISQIDSNWSLPRFNGSSKDVENTSSTSHNLKYDRKCTEYNSGNPQMVIHEFFVSMCTLI